MGAAVVAGFGKALEQLGPKVAEAIQNAVTGGRAGAGEAVPGLTDPLARMRSGLPPLVSPAAAAAATGTGGPAPVVVNVGDVEVATAGVDPAQIAREAGAALEARVLATLTASAASTDPGASPTLQGAGRSRRHEPLGAGQVSWLATSPTKGRRR